MSEISSKQKNFLNDLTTRTKYVLIKDIDSLTSYEATICINGILNDGKINELNGNKIDKDKKKEVNDLFITLVSIDNNKVIKEPCASDKQMKFLNDLIKDKYILKKEKLSKKEAKLLIDCLLGNKEDDSFDDYLEEIKSNEENDDSIIDGDLGLDI